MAITVGKLNFEKLIGTGSFGTTVFSGFYGDSRQPVAVKKLYRPYDVESNKTIKFLETEVMEEARGHPNILGYIWAEKDADFLYNFIVIKNIYPKYMYIFLLFYYTK